jgi:hypothetical protein
MSAHVVAYCSDQTHSSLARAARHLGFRPDQLRVLPTGSDYRMRPDDLAAAIDADRADGRLPFLVIANAGTTNTGAVDDLIGLAELCRERGIWLHVDAAYGGFAVLTERGRGALAGLELADSVTLDPHKWLAMPFEVGCVMVREGAALERAFELHPEYLREGGSHDRGVNFADRGLQLTRASRAIKVWLALETFGVDAFRTAIDRAIDLTTEAQRRIESDPRLELVSAASLGILTFRRAGAPGESPAEIDRSNEALVASLAVAGDVLLTGTRLHGRYVIRLCVLNHTSGWSDVGYALDRVATAAVSHPGDGTERASIQAAVDIDWLSSPDLGPDDLRRIPAFASVSDDQALRFLGTGRAETYAPGAVLTARWSLGRTFYIVASGRLSVRIDDREINVLGPGSHLGEIAAIDWGRDFGYGRTATVVAIEPTTVFAVPAAALRDLMAENEAIDRAIRSVAQERIGHR